MPAVAQATHPLGRPRNDVWYAGCHLLLTARAPEGPVRAVTANPTDEPFAVAVGLAALNSTDGSVQIKPGVLTASAVGSGHGSRVCGRGGRPRTERRIVGVDRPTILRSVGTSGPSGVGAEPAPHLATEVAGGDQMLEQRRRREPTFAELEIELALDGRETSRPTASRSSNGPIG